MREVVQAGQTIEEPPESPLSLSIEALLVTQYVEHYDVVKAAEPPQSESIDCISIDNYSSGMPLGAMNRIGRLAEDLGIPHVARPDFLRTVENAARVALAAAGARASRETTHRAPATRRPKSRKDVDLKLTTAEMEAVARGDSTLFGLHRRYAERLASYRPPPTGSKTTKEQAQEASRLASTYQNLVKRQIELKLEPLPKDPQVTAAERVKEAFYRKAAPRPVAARARKAKAAALRR